MNRIDEIQRDLACPGCEYNLRGLRGAVVTCPECGCECDVALMVTRRWTGPWMRAPGLSLLFLPVAWATLFGMAGAMALVEAQWIVRAVVMLVYIGGWCLLIWTARRAFDSTEGVHLALFAHLLLAGYFGSIAAVIGGALGFLSSSSSPSPVRMALGMLGYAAVTAGGCFVFVQVRRGERHIAERCIRRYLNRPPKP